MNTATASPEKLEFRCCIVGGGPAGMMLGFLLARAGIDVVVLEKHADFLRDFRGDTIHPSTLELMHELGVLEALLKLPHQQLRQLRAHIGDMEVVLGDFSHFRSRCSFVALMPQWDFLNFLAEQARRYPTFHLRTQAEVTGLIEDSGRVTGVRVNTLGGPLEIRADVVVGADGRNSVVRECSGLKVEELGAPMDLLWMRLLRNPSDPPTALRFDRGKILAMIDRGDYWQCALMIRKGGLEETQHKGITDLRTAIVEIAPFLRDRVAELRDWSDVKLLTVKVDRLRRWHSPGLLCIGDAAHAMSPIGGVGINLAIQDAVAAANILAQPLRKGVVSTGHLAEVQRRRMLPTRLTQGFQVIIQKRLIARVLATSERLELPWPLRLMLRSKFLSRVRGRVVGIGFRPEHVKTPDVHK
jgi:2-polyprenyl-6-methoxyphenol hydroxylase-like FAD-dependent oxidoreductase